MKKAALILIGLIGVFHIYIAWFEIFAWTSRGPKVFTTFPPDLFAQTVQMAANQGIYNAFLAAGLLWSLLIKDPKWQANIATCFLLFVLVAGITAAVTVDLRPGLAQIVPACLALAALHLGKRVA